MFPSPVRNGSIGRIVSVIESRAIVVLDNQQNGQSCSLTERPEMGTLMAIPQANITVLAIVSALGVPVPAQGDDNVEIWTAELGFAGEPHNSNDCNSTSFNRGVTVFPSYGDRVRVAPTD